MSALNEQRVVGNVEIEVSLCNIIFAEDYAHDYIIQIKTQRNSLQSLHRYIISFGRNDEPVQATNSFSFFS